MWWRLCTLWRSLQQIRRTQMSENINNVNYDTECSEDYRVSNMKKDIIVQRLKDRGCRITKQRLMLLDIILEEDCSCCKEIYYKASKKIKYWFCHGLQTYKYA